MSARSSSFEQEDLTSPLDQAWESMTLGDRLDLLASFAILINEKKTQFSHLIAEEIGKSLPECLAEVEKCINHVTITIDLMKSEKPLQDEIRSDPANPKASYLLKRYRPLGTVLVITPWNFPLWLPFKTIISALLAGNRVIHKPSRYAPRTNKLLRETVEESVLSLDAWKIVDLSYQEIESLIGSDEIQGVSFTGGTETGRKVAAMAAMALKPLVLELGGSDLLLLSENFNDYPMAARVSLKGRMQNNGQVCVATKRIAVPSEEGLAELKAHLLNELHCNLIVVHPETRTRKNGEVVTLYDPHTDNSDALIVTRLANEIHFKESVALLHDFLSTESEVEIVYGDRLWLDRTMVQIQSSEPLESLHFPPFIVANVDQDSPYWKVHEFMCPVLLISKVDQYKSIIQQCQHPSSHYGLGGTLLLSSDERESLVLHGKRKTISTHSPLINMRCGMISVNDCVVSHSLIPFGGVNMSGIGKECGVEGLRSFTFLQTIQVPKKDHPWTADTKSDVRSFEKKMSSLHLNGKLHKKIGTGTSRLTKTLGGMVTTTAKAAGGLANNMRPRPSPRDVPSTVDAPPILSEGDPIPIPTSLEDEHHIASEDPRPSVSHSDSGMLKAESEES